jgi:hypothetical protein
MVLEKILLGKKAKLLQEIVLVNQSLQNIPNSFNSYYIEDELFEKYDSKNSEIKLVQDTWNLSSLKLILSAL